MRKERAVLRLWLFLGAAAFLSACAAGVQGLSVTPGAQPGTHRAKPAQSCTSVKDSTGQTYTVAKLGGAPGTVNYSAQPCQVGIYVSTAEGPTNLDMIQVNGPYGIGIYFDNAGSGASEDHTQICVNGSNSIQLGTCMTGPARSSGSGLYIRNTPKIHVDHTSIDGYTAGFVMLPCPNPNNNFSDDHTSITNSTYPWTFQGGMNTVMHATPSPPPGGSCAGANVGDGNAPPGNFTEYPIPTGSSQPWNIAAGSDGALWFTEFGGNKIGRITTGGTISEYTVPTQYAAPYGIAAGSDNALWFTEFDSDKIGRITTSGSFSEYALPSGSTPYLIASGSDGALWFTEAGSNQIGRITTSGSITQYSSLSGAAFPVAITAGSDSALWFTAVDNSYIGRMTTGGSLTGYAVSGNPYLAAITSGPDNALWFAANTSASGGGELGRITTAGSITNEFSGNAAANFAYLAAGPDGNFWISDFGNNAVDRVTTTGTYTYYAIPTSNAYPTGIASGPDKAMWFVETDGNKIGRVTTGLSSSWHRPVRVAQRTR